MFNAKENIYYKNNVPEEGKHVKFIECWKLGGGSAKYAKWENGKIAIHVG